MEKIDLKKELKEFYHCSAKKISVVDVPELNYLVINGEGNPNTSKDFKQAIEALYALSYTIKFKIKKGPEQIDYGVMPLEGQWWCDNMKDFSVEDKDNWKWSVMIMQADFITQQIVDKAVDEVSKKKDLPAISKIYFVKQYDGLSVQTLHIGPYSMEEPTIERLHNFIKENNYAFSGKHREIYLNDPRRTSEDKLKTIIRQCVK